MNSIFSHLNYSQFTAPLCLNTVYHVNADLSYDVIRKDDNRTGYIALRTILGNGKISLEDGTTFNLSKDTLIFLDYASIASYKSLCSNWEFWWFKFECPTPDIFPKSQLLKINSLYKELEYCVSCLHKLREDNIYAHNLASATFSTLLNTWFYHLHIDRSFSPYQKEIYTTLEYISTHLNENISISYLSTLAHLSERRYRDVFTEIIGMSPKKYINNLRIDMAKEMLLTTSLSIETIAHHLGYSSSFYFSREFKKRTTTTPTSYRTSHYKKTTHPSANA